MCKTRRLCVNVDMALEGFDSVVGYRCDKPCSDVRYPVGDIGITYPPSFLLQFTVYVHLSLIDMYVLGNQFSRSY